MVPAVLVLYDIAGAQSQGLLPSCFLLTAHPPHGKGSRVFEGASLATRKQAAYGGDESKVSFCLSYIDM